MYIQHHLNSIETYLQVLKDVTTTFNIFMQWLKVHSPFSFTHQGSVVAISTSVVADSSVNCDQAYSISYAAENAIRGQTLHTVKLRRTDRVKKTKGSTNTVKSRGQSVVVNPAFLFHEGLMRKT